MGSSQAFDHDDSRQDTEPDSTSDVPGIIESENDSSSDQTDGRSAHSNITYRD